ncbi:MAG TPA: hypothetical protein VE890_10980 [Thermoguttaceae bacterium]|nr:hypothetical protein [Thermoguttaceae bacterium]
MGGGPLQWMLDTLGSTVICAIVGVILLVLAAIVWKIIAGRGEKPTEPSASLRIDVMALGTHGPPPGTPVLEFFNTPVRLAAIIIAPAGRVRDLPPAEDMADILDAIVPGLARIVSAHRPLAKRWPAQFSSKGFAHMFFQYVRLPGEGGKGTPWCSAAGIFKIEGQPMMAGMVFRTESTSSLGQEIIDAEEKWLNTLRVKG